MELRIKARKNLCDNQLQTMFAGIEAVYTKASCPYSHLNFLSESNIVCWLVFAKKFRQHTRSRFPIDRFTHVVSSYFSTNFLERKKFFF